MAVTLDIDEETAARLFKMVISGRDKMRAAIAADDFKDAEIGLYFGWLDCALTLFAGSFPDSVRNGGASYMVKSGALGDEFAARARSEMAAQSGDFAVGAQIIAGDEFAARMHRAGGGDKP